MAWHSVLLAQSTFNGKLINTTDSLPVPFAAIKLRETNVFILTDGQGRFSFPTKSATLTFEITAIGNHAVVQHHATYKDTETVYVNLTPNALTEYAFVGLSAEDVVRKAVAVIPENYADSSYFAYCTYRQYQKVNSRFMNLVEANPVVMYRLSRTKKTINADEAYAVRNFRRSKYFKIVFNGDDCNILSVNPIYHLAESSLQPGKFESYSFHFDTTAKLKDEYVINYFCNKFSSENHGISNYNPAYFHGESWETGKLYIDRSSFAFKRIERKSYKHPGYSYWGKPNMVIGTTYFIELVNGDLALDYKKIKGKWYLNAVNYQFTNDFYKAVWGKKEYTITDNYQWQCDSVSRYVDESLVNKFYHLLPGRVYNYDKAFWDTFDFPYQWHNKDSVLTDIAKSGYIEGQFLKESQREEK